MPSTGLQKRSKGQSELLRRVATFLKVPERKTPDEWAAENRSYPHTTGLPGPRDPHLTPYMVPLARAVASGRYERAAAATSAQSGKTETALDLIGHILGFEVGFDADKYGPEALRKGRFTLNFKAEEPPVLRQLDIESNRYRPALDALLDNIQSLAA